MNMNKLSGAAAVALLLGTTAGLAQTTLTGTRAIDDSINDINYAVTTDLARGNDDYRFGNPEFRPGLSGSASLSYTGKDGDNDSQELTLGARLRFAQGQLVQTIGALVEFTEATGTKTKQDVFGIYDANYYFTDRFYGFVLGRVVTDGLADAADDFKHDAFIGIGPGYRIVNTPDFSWRVQAGVGLSYTEDGLGNDTSEVGGIASSRVFYQINEALFLTNDTDILTSDAAFRVSNDFGVNYKMSDMFATRVSLLTDYNDSRADRTENKLGVSLVYSF
ncbi:DUF481 domain-containing protein [Paracoccaceae bacterium Fryx2]|nr:DUF481 domain-containing protein [Paracoccaceae bacterium Fryx2]